MAPDGVALAGIVMATKQTLSDGFAKPFALRGRAMLRRNLAVCVFGPA